MSNPPNPQPYSLAPNVNAFLVADDSEALRLLFHDTHYRFAYNWGLSAVARGPNRQPWSRYDGPEVLDHADIPNSPNSWRSRLTGGGSLLPSPSVPISANVVLYNPAGWGREIELLIEGESGLGHLNVGSWAYIFGSYSGTLFAQRGSAAPLYELFYPAVGDPPIWPFAPDSLPLYSFQIQSGLWPSNVYWPSMQVLQNDPGRLRVKVAATNGVEDRFHLQDFSGVFYDSGDRNIKVIYKIGRAHV